MSRVSALPHGNATDPVATNRRGLKKDALSFLSNLVIGVASTAPAYSLAAVLGALTLTVGFDVPGILIAAFVPVLFVAVAYYHLNRADPDCGTSFSWVTRAMGPYWGWMAGWAIIATDILVMPGLAQVAALYSFRLFGIDHPGWFTQAAVGVGWIALMTAICYLGIELSARMQKLLLLAEIAILLILAVGALAKVYDAVPPVGSQHIALTWFNPFGVKDVGCSKISPSSIGAGPNLQLASSAPLLQPRSLPVMRLSRAVARPEQAEATGRQAAFHPSCLANRAPQPPDRAETTIVAGFMRPAHAGSRLHLCVVERTSPVAPARMPLAQPSRT